MKKALIFGITGQDGSYLSELLLQKEYVVHGVIRRASSFNTQRIEHLLDRLILHYGDVTDGLSVFNLLSEIRPTEVYNLAAQSHVKVSFELPHQTSQTDGLAVINILEAFRQIPLVGCRLYQASTSEMFGGSQSDYSPREWETIRLTGMNEHCSFHPKSPYAASKLFAHHMVDIYRRSYGLFAVCGILFNHESERRDHRFVTRKVTAGASRRAAGSHEKLILGNLDAQRDWFHARDAVTAMHAMLQQEEPTDFVVGSGRVYSVRDLVRVAFKAVGITIEFIGEGLTEKGVDTSTGDVLVEVDVRYTRPNEVSFLKSDPRKVRAALKWETLTSFEDMIAEMVRVDLITATKDLAVVDRKSKI